MLPFHPHPHPAQPLRSWPPAGPRSGYPCLTEVGESRPTTNYDDVEDCKSDLEGECIDWGLVIQWILTMIVVIMVKVTVMIVITVKTISWGCC